MTDSPLLPKFRDLAREGQQIGQDIEKGQASTPLADHCLAVLNDLQYQPRTLTLVSLSASARTQAIRWLLGEENQGVSVQLSRLGGLIEIHLAEHGYALFSADGQRLEFDTLSSFMGALESNLTQQPAESEHQPHRVALAAPAGSQGLTILLPESLDATGVVVGLASELIARSQILLTAHSLGGPRPTTEDIDRLRHLATGIGCVLPVLVPVDDAPSPDCWWLELQGPGVLVLNPLTLAPPAPPTLLNGAVLDLLPHLSIQNAAKRLQLAADALRERQERDLRQMDIRRGREEPVSRVDVVDETTLKRPFDQARNSASEEISALSKASVESSKRSFLPEGALSIALAEELRGLTHDDIERDVVGKVYKLTLSGTFQAHLAKALRRGLKEELSRDLVMIRDGLAALQSKLVTGLEAGYGAPVNLSLTPPSESELWQRISEFVSLDVRYRGELPRRGFIQRLGEGRRAVFAGMMILSLVGSFAGFSWRGIGVFGVVFFLIFLGVVAYTFKSWQKEDAAKLDEELDRIREQLANECQRVARDVQREKQSRIADALEGVKRSLQQRVDDLFQERKQRERASLAEQNERAKSRMRKLDQQIKESQAMTQRIRKLNQDAAGLCSDAERAVRELARKNKLSV